MKRVFTTAGLAALALVLVAVGVWIFRTGSLVPTPVRFAAPFGDRMVVQRDAPLPVWGTARPGATVWVFFDDASERAEADAYGNWRVVFPPRAADARVHRIAASATGGSAMLDEVLLGDVLLAAGQSNLMQPASDADGAEEAASDLENPCLRWTLAEAPPNAPWTVSGPATAPHASALAWHLGRRLQKDRGVPVGVIVCAYGPSYMIAWRDLAADPGASYASDLDRRAQAPGNLYRDLVLPLAGLSVRWVVWVHGETDCGRNALFVEDLAALIAEWRDVWKPVPLDWTVVGLGPYPPANSFSHPPLWAAAQAAQAEGAALAGARFVSAADLADTDDGSRTRLYAAGLHPWNKRALAARIAEALADR